METKRDGSINFVNRLPIAFDMVSGFACYILIRVFPYIHTLRVEFGCLIDLLTQSYHRPLKNAIVIKLTYEHIVLSDF